MIEKACEIIWYDVLLNDKSYSVCCTTQAINDYTTYEVFFEGDEVDEEEANKVINYLEEEFLKAMI